jgi:trehalose/maltose hydrolase-like predicted phosphorylase
MCTHSQYACDAPDYENALFGESLKQADVTLMGYPLQYDMPAQVRLNDLLYEVAYTNVNGPAMTHAIFAIAFLELGENYTSHATQEFRQSYGLYVNGPFKVWLECPPPGCIVSTNTSTNSSNHDLPTHPVPPCPNFITGAGGFLQTMLYGYFGLRYESDHLRLSPSLPPQTTSLALRRLQFQGAVLDATHDASSITLSLAGETTGPLYVVDAANRGHRLVPGATISLPVGLTRLYRQ